MFENEVNEILDKQKESIKLIEKLNKIYEPYNYSNKIFSLDVRIHESENSITNKAKMALFALLHDYNITKVIKSDDLNKMAKEVKSVTIDDFYFPIACYIPNALNNKYIKFCYKCENNIFEKSHHQNENDCIYTLNCIWLLDNPKPINKETRQKIYKLAKEGKTFVFKGCKVTRYKKGSIKIVFSDSELFNRFKEHFDNALSRSFEEFKKNNN